MTTVTGKAFILAALLLVLAGAVLMKARAGPDRAPRDITLAVSVQPLSAPVYVAREKGFFRKEGLRVALQPHQAGADALHAVLAGRADFGTVADTPIMFAGMKGQGLSVIATIGSSPSYVRIVARKDRGIIRPGDLRGKTIGVRAGTSSEYFLSAFLTFNGINERDIHVVNMQPSHMADALVKGELDAAVSWNPYTAAQQEALGGNAVTFTNKYVYVLDWNIVGNRDFVKRDPEAVERLLRALVQATDHMRDNPGEAREITARWMGRKDASLAGGRFDVHLEQSLLVNLETQARWAIRRGLTDREEVPDYLPMLYTRGLEKVRPEAVTVIRE